MGCVGLFMVARDELEWRDAGEMTSRGTASGMVQLSPRGPTGPESWQARGTTREVSWWEPCAPVVRRAREHCGGLAGHFLIFPATNLSLSISNRILVTELMSPEERGVLLLPD